MRGEIQVPDDHTMFTFTTYFVEYDFSVIIEPCVVGSYVADIVAADISYQIG